MKHLLLLPVLLLAACGDNLSTPEGATDAMISALNDAADALKTVKDAKSAEAARPKLVKISKRLDDIQAAMQKMTASPSLEAKKGAEMSKAQANFEQAMMALPNDPEVHKILDSIFK